MANFKGGFAFNNEAAKVEVEQAPDGTLISCVNPVTGEELGGGNSKEVIEATAANIFNSITEEEYTALITAIRSGNASATLIIDASALGISDPLTGPAFISDTNFFNVQGFQFSGSVIDGFMLSEGFDADHNFSTGIYSIQSSVITNINGYASALPTILTIYHHPMP